MTIKYFNHKFKRQGGIKTLSDMRDDYQTLQNISRHFGISKERTRQWMVIFFGEKYDPRPKRKEIKIQAIQTLIEKHGIEKTRALYSGTNKSYLREAINRFKNTSSHKYGHK